MSATRSRLKPRALDGDTREVLARVLAEEKLMAPDEPAADADADTALRAGRRFALESRRSGVLL